MSDSEEAVCSTHHLLVCPYDYETEHPTNSIINVFQSMITDNIKKNNIITVLSRNHLTITTYYQF